MGQGVYTSIAMILAEELDADSAASMLEHAPPNDKLYGNPVFGIQATGNSNSIRAFWTPLRKAGASARAMLVQAAAQRMARGAGDAAPPRDGEVVAPTPAAASSPTATWWMRRRKITAAQEPPLKDPKNSCSSASRSSASTRRHKVNGRSIYGIDAMLPGMKFATIAASPCFGGKVGHVDEARRQERCPAYKRSSCSTTWWRWSAITCGRPSRAWRRSPSSGTRARTRPVSSDAIWRDLRAARPQSGVVAKTVGDVEKGARRGRAIRGRLRAAVPGPRDHGADELHGAAEARVSCEVWLGTQIMTRVQRTSRS